MFTAKLFACVLMPDIVSFQIVWEMISLSVKTLDGQTQAFELTDDVSFGITPVSFDSAIMRSYTCDAKTRIFYDKIRFECWIHYASHLGTPKVPVQYFLSYPN